ncbi:MAG: aminofutalosine synthase MqnE, partial [Desulfococcaceae bacterium]
MAFSFSDPRLVEIAARLDKGERLGPEDGIVLFESSDIIGVGRLADRDRRRRHGDRAFFIQNQHLNYTNVCRNQCRFCAFGRDSDRRDGAFTMNILDVRERLLERSADPVREIHIVGGVNPSLPFQYYLDMIRTARFVRPKATIKAFTAVEIDHMAQLSGLGLTGTIRALKEAGLGMVPGGGAEVLCERIWRELYPNKIGGDRWLEVTEALHREGVVTNATLLYGHIETVEERVRHLLRLRELQDRTGGFSAFIPLAFHPANTELSDLSGPGAVDDLKMVSVARLMLDNFDHVKAYWVMLGERLAQVALSFGADDLDGTIVEEKITHMAGATSPSGLARERMVELIRSAGFEPVERDSFYRAVEAEGGSWKSEVGSQESGVGSQESGVGSQKPEVGSQKPEDSNASRPYPSVPVPGKEDLTPILNEAAQGQRISPQDALALLQSADLLTLAELAEGKRWALHPEPLVTFVIDRNINYTNVCASGCRFCAFFRCGDDEDAYVIERDTLRAKIQETVELGGTQILLQGGMHPDLDLDFYTDLLRFIHDEFDIHVHGFSPPEIAFLVKKTGLSPEKVLQELIDAGLNSIPGGGAEILVDEVRDKISPRKCSAGEWLEVMRVAHRLGLRTSATMMFGHVESPEDVVA